MMSEEEFLELVKREVDDQPRLLGKLLKFVADNWNSMVEAQKAERESSHLHALSQMLDNLWAIHLHGKKNPRLFTNLECCTILDAADAVMPGGTGGSSAQRELLAHLAKSFRALGWSADDDFIKKIRRRSDLLRNIYVNHPEKQQEAK